MDKFWAILFSGSSIPDKQGGNNESNQASIKDFCCLVVFAVYSVRPFINSPAYTADSKQKENTNTSTTNFRIDKVLTSHCAQPYPPPSWSVNYKLNSSTVRVK